MTSVSSQPILSASDLVNDRFFDLSQDLLCITGLDGTFKRVNRMWTQVLGYGEDELLGRPFVSFVHPEDLPAMMALMGQAGADLQVIATSNRYRCKDGAYRWLEWRWAMDPERDLVYAIARDVTERQHDEQRLRTLEALVEHAAVGMVLTDLAGTLTFANAAVRDAYGYGADTVGMSIPQLLPPDEQATFGPMMGDLMASGQMTIESRFNCREGGTRPISVAALLIRDEGGAPLATAAIIRDLTAEHEREQELRLMKLSLDRSPDNIHWIDPTSRIVYANDGASKMLGYAREELLQLKLKDIDPVFPMQDWQGVWGRLQQQGVLSFESQHQRKDGSRIPVELVANFLSFEGREFACVIARDISERKQAEDERAILREEVIAAQQAALRELSTPLIPIAEQVVVMPIIGSIDSGRAQQVLEILLNGVAERQARTAILDITGVPVVDTQVANALLRAAQSVRLLGCEVVLTGIRPEVAQTLVGLGADLSGIATRGSLQSGIAYALQR